MAFEFNHNQQDRDYTSTVALAQAGANSATFDLEQTIGGDIDKLVFEIVAPAVAGITDAKVVTYTFKDSADGVTFAAVDPTIVTTQTAAGGAGVATKTVRFRMPPVTRRYVRIEQTMTATAGTVTGSFISRLLF
jgi:hypothetical protein